MRKIAVLFATCLVLALLLVSCAAPSSVSEDMRETVYTDSENEESLTITERESADESQTENGDKEDKSGFEIYFLDVGQGDASLILCDGHAMLIDGGLRGKSDYIYSFLKKHGIKYLDYIVCTHPHEDHAGGLSGALNYASVGTALCSVESYDSKTFSSFLKYLGKQGKTLTVPSAGDSFSLGSAVFTVLGPVQGTDRMNDYSLVIKVKYGKCSFLFTGDAEREEELSLIESGADLKCDLLKVAHHGSDSSTCYPFLREALPKISVISCGKDNAYGHPDEAVLSRLSDADSVILRTDLSGMIRIDCDGESIVYSAGK